MCLPLFKNRRNESDGSLKHAMNKILGPIVKCDESFSIGYGKSLWKIGGRGCSIRASI